MYLRKRLCVAIGASWLFAFPAYAAAPVYFDLGGLVFYVFGTLISLIVFPTLAIRSKDRTTRHVFIGLSIVGLGLMAVPVIKDLAKEQKYVDGAEEAAIAFSNFCKSENNGTTIKATASGRAVGILVQQVKPQAPHKWIGGAAKIATVLQTDMTFCNSSSLGFMEEAEAEHGFKRIDLCSAPQTIRSSQDSTSEYELQVDESTEVTNAPGKVPWGVTEMHKSVIRLVKKGSSEVIHEEAFHFVNPPIMQISSRCPDQNQKLKDMLVRLFPNK